MTDRLGTNRIISSDIPTVDIHVNDILDQLDDIIAIDMQGPIALRPYAGIRGRFWNATDQNDQLYRDNGTSWIKISPPPDGSVTFQTINSSLKPSQTAVSDSSETLRSLGINSKQAYPGSLAADLLASTNGMLALPKIVGTHSNSEFRAWVVEPDVWIIFGDIAALDMETLTGYDIEHRLRILYNFPAEITSFQLKWGSNQHTLTNTTPGAISTFTSGWVSGKPDPLTTIEYKPTFSSGTEAITFHYSAIIEGRYV